MPVQVFVDDSGGVGQGRYLVLAGLISPAEDWALFSDEWRECLESYPSVRCFKMREAAALTGQFRWMSESQRDQKLIELAGIMNRHAKRGIYAAIDLNAHAELLAPLKSKPANAPYFLCFNTIVQAACFELLDLGWAERFEIIFDENVIFGPRVKAWYRMTVDLCELQEPEAGRILPIEPTFRNDEEFLPIQACDLWAWCLRRGNDDKPGDPFNWLLEYFPDLLFSAYSICWGRERLERIVGIIERETALIMAGEPLRRAFLARHAYLFPSRKPR